MTIDAAYSRSFYPFHWSTFPLSTGSRRSSFSFRSRKFYRPKMILDRDTNKCYYNDITKYLDKYRNKHSLTSTKASASINTKYDKYILLPLLWVQFPRRPNAAPPLPSTPPQHSPHTVPTHLYPSATQPPPRICTPPTRRPDVAPTQLYAAPT